ncbi:MAG: glucose 1-dehydrogenase [Chloroflexi bacterium]|nr:glucose 1-dehydrogenase [Chloroflexota bacterium]
MANLFRVDDKVAVVVGGAGGIGELLGHGLAEYGAKVAIADINLPKAEEVAQDIRLKLQAEAVAFQVDVADEGSVAKLVEQVVSKYGTVDILVNSQRQRVTSNQAGTEIPVADWDMMFNVNVKSIMLTCREFGKLMTGKKSGKVINLSSVRGIRANLRGGNEAYCATKGAVDMITRSLASEWAQYNINVNAIGPSVIATPSSKRTFKDPKQLQKHIANMPMKRMGTTEDIVGACIFLASPASDFITGQILYVDGGLTAVV